MFGKPEWFKEKRLGWGLTPIAWQGWSYAAIWAGILVLPFLLLVSQQLAVEAMLWLSAAMGVLIWDVRQIRTAMRSRDEDVIHIDETGTVSEEFATRNFDFRLRA